MAFSEPRRNQATNRGYPLHPLGVYPNIYLSTQHFLGERLEKIKVVLFGQEEGDGYSFTLTPREARLLAKRLNQICDDRLKKS